MLNWILAGMGIAALCLLAGARDETVGVDVLSYAKWMCLNAHNMDFHSFIKFEERVAEAGWNIFTWLTVRLTGGLNGYLACIELLCVFPVYLLLKHCFPRAEWVGMLVWLLLQYSFSLNGMRQSVAMSFCVYAMRFVMERKPLAFLLCVSMAAQFHQTALVMFAVYPYWLLRSDQGTAAALFGRWRNVSVALLLIVVLTVIFIMAPRFVIIASSLKESYSYQLKHLGESDFSYAGLYLLLSSLLMKRLSSKDFDYGINRMTFNGLSDIITVGAVAWQLNYITPTLGRIGYYGTVLFCIEASMLASSGKRSTRHLIVLVGIAAVYFVGTTILMGHSGVYPYTSFLLGIG